MLFRALLKAMGIQQFLACRGLKTSLKYEDKNGQLITDVILKNIRRKL
jgi:hypothetical protein